MSDDSEDPIAEILRDYEPIPDHLLLEWTNRLKEGEFGNKAHGIAKYMIEDFYLAVALGKQPPQITMEWIADVLGEILENGKPEARKPFSLMPKRRGGKDQTSKHIEIAKWVWIAIVRGYDEPNAIKMAAAVFFQDEKTIRRAWNQCGKGDGWNFRDNEVTAEIFKQIKRPLPPPKHKGTTKK